MNINFTFQLVKICVYGYFVFHTRKNNQKIQRLSQKSIRDFFSQKSVFYNKKKKCIVFYVYLHQK